MVKDEKSPGRTKEVFCPLLPFPGLGIANNAERDQNSNRSANWIWRSRFAVSVMSPAVPL